MLPQSWPPNYLTTTISLLDVATWGQYNFCNYVAYQIFKRVHIHLQLSWYTYTFTHMCMWKWSCCVWKEMLLLLWQDIVEPNKAAFFTQMPESNCSMSHKSLSLSATLSRESLPGWSTFFPTNALCGCARADPLLSFWCFGHLNIWQTEKPCHIQTHQSQSYGN